MSDVVQVTVQETPVVVTVADDTPTVSITDNETSQVTVTQAATQVSVNVDDQPQITVNTGAGGFYDKNTLLEMVLGTLDLSHFDQTVAQDILHARDLWERVATGLLLTFEDGTAIQEAGMSFTQQEISSVVADITIRNGEVDASLSSITQRADSIDSRIDSVELDINGQLTVQGSRILQTEQSIDSTVLRLDSVDDTVSAQQSAISQLADSITLEVTARQQTDMNLIETNTTVEATADALALSVSNIEGAGGVIERLTAAEVTIEDDGILLRVVEKDVDRNNYVAETVQTMLSSQWGVEISETIAGQRYATGFGLVMRPVWELNKEYLVGDEIQLWENTYKCLVAHTATYENNPEADPVTWELLLGNLKSEFVVQADVFKVLTASGAAPVFSVTDDVISLDTNVEVSGKVTIGVGSSGYANLTDKPVLGDLAYIDVVETAKLGTTVIDGGYIKTSLINAGAIAIGDLSGAGSLASQDQTDLSLTPSDNQIPNPDFELGLGGWVVWNTENPLETSSKVTLHARTDTPYGKWILRATGAVNFETKKYIPVSEGKTYFGEIWVRPAQLDSVDNQTRFYAGVRHYDYNKDWIANNYFIASNVVLTTYLGWHKHEGTFTAPTGTSYIRAMGLLNYQGTADDGILDVGYMRISEVEAGADVTAKSTFVQVTYPNDKTALQNDIDSKIISWFTSSDPSASWSGTNTSHAGDMWWNTSTNKLKRYSGTAWSAELTDQKAIDAYANAAIAQDTADEKRRVFTATPTPPYDIGDLWDRGSTLGIWRANTAATTTYSLTHWQAVADVTANNTANDTSNVNGLPSTNVSGWAHPTDRTTIHGGKIYTGSITAQQIAAGTITAAEIAAGSITAESGVVGSLDADKITTGTLSAGSVKVSSNDGKTYFLGDTLFVYDASNQLRVKIGRLS